MLIREDENKIKIYKLSKKPIREFLIQDNLNDALALLKKINQVQTIDKLHIFQTKLYKNYGLWSFYQQNIFWNSLRDFIKYKPVLDYLVENKITRLEVDNLNPSLVRMLKIFKVIFSKEKFSLFRKIKSWLLFLMSHSLARLITDLAVLKLKFGSEKTLIYTPDKYQPQCGCDFRFAPVYNFLKDKKLNYLEVFHTLYGWDFFKNILLRKRVVIYLEALKPIKVSQKDSMKYNLDNFTRTEKILVENLLKDFEIRANKSLIVIDKLVKILKSKKIKKLIAMDDMRYTNELIVACRENNIQNFGFQHGHYTKYLVGYMNYEIPNEYNVTFDKLFVWNEYWKRVLLDYSSQYNENNVEVGGPLRKLPDYDLKEKRRLKKLSDLSLLVILEPLSAKFEVGEYINELLSKDVKVLVSLRPDSSSQEQFSQYNIKNFEKIEQVNKIDKDILNKINAVAGTYSTFLNEMMYYKKPIVLFKTSFNHGHRLLEDNFVFPVDKTSLDKIIDYINNYQSKKNQAWPSVQTSVEETLSSLN